MLWALTARHVRERKGCSRQGPMQRQKPHMNIWKGKGITGRYHRANSCMEHVTVQGPGKIKGSVKPRSLANVAETRSSERWEFFGQCWHLGAEKTQTLEDPEGADVSVGSPWGRLCDVGETANWIKLLLPEATAAAGAEQAKDARSTVASNVRGTWDLKLTNLCVLLGLAGSAGAPYWHNLAWLQPQRQNVLCRVPALGLTKCGVKAGFEAERQLLHTCFMLKFQKVQWLCLV